MKFLEGDRNQLASVYMPSLIYMLQTNERRKGSDLTKEEVEEICDKAHFKIVELSQLKEIAESRNYKDINPENCWNEWLQFKEMIDKNMSKNNTKEVCEYNNNVNAHISFVPIKRNFLSKIISWDLKDELVTKFGGRPCLIKKTEWPRSRLTKKLMKFICQIRLDKNLFDGLDDKIVYLFMTDDINVSNTFDPEGGENAVIIKSVNDPEISRLNLFPSKGPSLEQEYKTEIIYKEEPVFTESEWKDSQYSEYIKSVEGNKIAGRPAYVERDEPIIEEGWRLLLQIDSSDTPFEIDFGGGGVGYLFINSDCSKGKFLWQCD